ncbi:MAG: HAMP domain-containing sensor histidine kinase [Anaerolineales bacterium]
MRTFLSPPVFPDDEEKTRAAGFLNTILLIVLLMVVGFASLSFFLTLNFSRILIEIFLVLVSLGILFLMHRGYVRLASITFSSALLIIVSIGTYLSGGFGGTTMSAYIGIIIITGLLLGNWTALAYALIAIAFTGWMVYDETLYILPIITEKTDLILLWGEFASVLLGIVGLLALVMTNLKRSYERTKRNEEELAYRLVESEQLSVWAQEASDFKSHLLARVSHELRTPLGVIVGMAEMLRLEAYGTMTDEQKKLLERIQVNSKFLETTFSELLEQSQVDKEILPMQVVSFSPAGILKKVLPELQQEAIERGLHFEEQIAPELPDELLGVPSRVEQILFHLTRNAVKFTDAGSVKVDLLKPDHSHWAIRVTDTGIGIPREHRESIFEPFRQVDESIAREYGGVGLGLSIVKRLTSSMKGTIRVESDPGKGSTFTVTLPLVNLTTDVDLS